MAIPVTVTPAGCGSVTEKQIYSFSGAATQDLTYQSDSGETVTVKVKDGNWYKITSVDGRQLTATPAAGYRFKRFVVNFKYSWYVSGGSSGDLSVGKWITTNPCVQAAGHTVYDMTELIGEYVRTLGSQTETITVESVEAVFELIPVHGSGIIYSPANDKIVYSNANGRPMYYE